MSRSSPPPRTASVRRERNAIETRRRLLDAAESEFAAKGFAGVRLREVAQTVGVQQALIHHYFEDKEGLYRAVLDRAIEPITSESWTILSQASSLEQLLDAFLDLLLRFCDAHANLLAMLRMEATSGSHFVLDTIQQKSHPVFEAVELLLLTYQKKGQIRTGIPPSEIIQSILALTLFPSLEAPLLQALWPASSKNTADIQARKNTLQTMILQGLGLEIEEGEMFKGADRPLESGRDGSR